MIDYNKLRIYAIKDKYGGIAKCIKSGHLLVGPANQEYKLKMKRLLEILVQERPDVYTGCKLIRMKQTWL